MAKITFNITRPELGNYDGETVEWLILHGVTVADLSTAMNHVSDLVADELTGGAYSRGTIDLIVDQVGDQAILTRDPGSSVPLADTSDSEDPTVVVIYDPTGGSDSTDKLIFAGDVDEAPGFTDWPIDVSNGIAVVAEGTGDGSGASDDSALTVTATATYAKNATAGAALETSLTTIGVPATEAATQAYVVENFVVTEPGDTQEELNDNLSGLSAYGLIRAEVASTRATEGLNLASLGAALEAAITVPTVFLRCGYGEESYGASADRGFWRCPTRLPSPSTSLEIRTLSRIVQSPSRANGNQFQEGLSESLDAGTGAFDRFEDAIDTTDGYPRLYWEKTASGGTSEDVIFKAGALPVGPWFQRRVLHNVSTNVVTLQVRCDAVFDTTAGDGTTWLTLGTKDFGASTTIAASTYSYQWIGRGAGLFDIARIQARVDGTLVLDADPAAAGATEGDTTFEDQVLESSPGTPAVWTAQHQADVGEETVAAGSGDVTGPSSSTDGHAVVFDGTTGKAIESAGAAPVLTSRTLAGLDLSADRSAAALRSALGLGAQALEEYSSMTRMMVQPSVGDWFSQPHGGVSTGTPTLSRLYYVPIWIPKGCTKVDGIAAEVTTVASSSVCRLGLYDVTSAGKPGSRLIDGGTVDFSSGGGSAGVRTLSISATDVTPDRMYYVAVVQQGAATAMRITPSGESLRAPGYPSSTVADVFGATPNVSYYEAGVTGALPSTATPVLGTNLGFAAPVVALKRNT